MPEVNKLFYVVFLRVADKAYKRFNVNAYHRGAAEMFGWNALEKDLRTKSHVGWLLVRCEERKESSENHPDTN